VRHEVVALLEELLPVQLAAGGFRAVAHILRELRVIAARAPGLDEELHRAVLSFEERLSEPEILEQLFRVLEDPAGHPMDDDVAEVLRELKPKALPLILAHLGRTLDPAIRRALEPSIDGLARSQPQLLVEVLNQGPVEALPPAIGAVARLNLIQLIPQLTALLKHEHPEVRLATVRALGEIGTPTAVGALSQALDDDERNVRQAALAILVNRGGSGALEKQLEAMLFDGDDRGWERSERRAFFEAYGQFAGEKAIPKLEGLLQPRGVFRRKVPPEVRACVLFALGKIRTFEARLIVDRHTADKEAVVRSAASSLLRDWVP
jgi:HEAT repeat protein